MQNIQPSFCAWEKAAPAHLVACAGGDANGWRQQIAQAAVVVIETNRGVIEVVLDAERAPQTVANFLAYVAADGYKDALFIGGSGFMVQTGGYRSDLTLLPESDELRNEADNGLIISEAHAMARMDAIDSATRQFFINVMTTHTLIISGKLHAARGRRASGGRRATLKPRTCASFGYAVFGRVVAGMEVVDDIADQDTDIQGDFLDFPVEPILIKQIVIK